jgi:lysine-N-methylase
MQVDIPTQQRYITQAPQLMDSLKAPGEHAIMKRDPKTDYCIKFEGGLCGIQREHGEAFLGDACHFYPRSLRKLGGDVNMTATLSCPEIARLSLFGDKDVFAENEVTLERLPLGLQDYLPEGLTAGQANIIHHSFLKLALDAGATPQRNYMRIFTCADSLSRMPVSAWPNATPFYLEHADNTLPLPAARDTDSIYLLQALCGLIAAAKYVHHARLMQTVREMEQALHVTIQMDSLMIAALPDSPHAVKTLEARWKSEWQRQYEPLLKRYLAMQVSLALLPFAGFGHTLPERAAVIGVRFATVKLALMSLCHATGGNPEQKDVVRAVQSLSRFLDHLAEADFSLKIYTETGWLQPARLRALVGDGM